MGTSFADRAWGGDSAVYRVTGVLTVVSGWFMTALLAFTISAVFATIIFYAEAYGAILLLIVAAVVIWRNHLRHVERAKTSEMDKIFNLKKVTNLHDTLYTTFEHMSYLLREIRLSLNRTLGALFSQNKYVLGVEKGKTKKFQRYSNIITANIFKAMRLMQKEEIAISYRYGQTIRRLQKLVDGHRDIVMRSHVHVSNYHKGLLDLQINELEQTREILDDILAEVESMLSRRRTTDIDKVAEKTKNLYRLAKQFHENQLERIRAGESKTRLSILFYSIVGNAMMLSKQNLKLLEIFRESFAGVTEGSDFDLD
jgi:hypothetical protein